MKKEEIIGWIKTQYDKIILVAVLAAIVVSLLILIFSAGREARALAGGQWQQPPPVNARQKPDDHSAIHDAIEAASEPFQLGGWTTRMVVAELRVSCVKCGQPIPVNADVCPFQNCRAQQPKIVTREADADYDAIPDKWESQYGLNPALDDSAQDADADGFTNLEEYDAGTNPKDPDSAPPPVTKLRVLKAGRIAVPFIFSGYQQLTTNETDFIFQIKNKRRGSDSYLRIGDAVEGYKITGFEKKTVKVDKETAGYKFSIDKDVSTIKVSRDGKDFELAVGDKSDAQGEPVAQLVYLIDNSRKNVKKGDVLVLKNNRYKIVDIVDKNVIVADMRSGVETTLAPAENPVK